MKEEPDKISRNTLKVFNNLEKKICCRKTFSTKLKRLYLREGNTQIARNLRKYY